MRIRSFVLLIALTTLAPDRLGAGAGVSIDGNTSDWASLRPLPLDYDSTFAPDSLGTIEEVKITQDGDFIFVSLRFATARPGGTPSGAPPNRWVESSYFEIDTQGDALWDYRAKLMPGKRMGLNNLAILRRQGSGGEGRIFLFPEGHKRYAPLGPRAYLSADSKSLEMRVPRAPLGLKSGIVYIRFLVKFRDVGSAEWMSRHLPADGGWIGLQLLLPEPDAEPASSAAREREPVVPRSELEGIVTSRYAKGTEPFVIPVVTPEPLFNRRAIEPETEMTSPARRVRPVMMIDSAGEVVNEGKAPILVPERSTEPPAQSTTGSDSE